MSPQKKRALPLMLNIYGKSLKCSCLSNAELLAIFLRMGIKGKNVLDMSSDLIQSAGSLDALAHMEAAEIANICKGIGMAKAATLSAAFELGARALREWRH